jgi:Fur family transcriptional regulator, peroxide stress response regulator
MNDFTDMLREHNLKATPQRLAIMDIISIYGHINIDTLYDEVKKRFNSISLATIYKNINAMTKNFLLLEVKVPNEKSVYEVVKDNHSHLMCTHCGKIIDIELDTENMLNDISKQHQFNINQSDLVFSGVCKDCHK